MVMDPTAAWPSAMAITGTAMVAMAVTAMAIRMPATAIMAVTATASRSVGTAIIIIPASASTFTTETARATGGMTINAAIGPTGRRNGGTDQARRSRARIGAAGIARQRPTVVIATGVGVRRRPAAARAPTDPATIIGTTAGTITRSKLYASPGRRRIRTID